MNAFLLLSALCGAPPEPPPSVSAAVAVEWAWRVPKSTAGADSFIASDGVRYEKCADGIYRRAAVQPTGAPGVTQPRPFQTGDGIRPTPVLRADGSNSLSTPSTPMVPTITGARSITRFGRTDNCTTG